MKDRQRRKGARDEDVLVTVLMACRDPHAGFFWQALNSVFEQTSSAWELRVIDDHTTDGAALEVLRELESSSDGRIAVLESESQLITGAFNTGMRHAKTPFVCILHCDDLLHASAIAVLSDYIGKYPGVDYFHSSRRYIEEAGRPLSSICLARGSFDLADFKDSCPVKALHCWRVRAALEVDGMDESLGLHGADDYDFPWRMAEDSKIFKAIPDCLYLVRDHREHYRLTTHVPLEVQVRELKRIWRKHGLTEEEIAEQTAIRSAGYLKQALFVDEGDKQAKETAGFDPRTGWREPYS